MRQPQSASSGRGRLRLRSWLLPVFLTAAVLAMIGLVAIWQADTEQRSIQPLTPPARQIERTSLRPDRTPGS